jgi:hypothetical protein
VKAHDLRQALGGVATGTVTTAEEDAAAFPRLASFNAGAVYVGRFSGQTPWERLGRRRAALRPRRARWNHPAGREGRRVSVAAGSAFVVPRGLWHRQHARPSVTLLAAVPDDSEISEADDPRG